MTKAEIVLVLTLSTVYFDAPYPIPAATSALRMICSGTGPLLASHPWTALIDDVNINLTEFLH